MATRRSSISRRLIISMIIAMPLLLGLTAAAIDRAYLSSLLKAEENRLQAQFFSLLGAVGHCVRRVGPGVTFHICSGGKIPCIIYLY